jgi:hypothetical protein
MPTAPSWLCAEKKSRGSRCCEEYANVDEEEEEENTNEKNTNEKLTREWLAAKIKADLEAQEQATRVHLVEVEKERPRAS